jgi:hypothetical protein
LQPEGQGFDPPQLHNHHPMVDRQIVDPLFFDNQEAFDQ